MRDSANIVTLWYNLLSSLTSASAFVRQAAPPASSASSPPQETFRQDTPTVAEPNLGGAGVSVEISAQGPIQVTLHLSPRAEQLFLATPGLHALSAEKPPLRDITFLPGLDGAPARLRIQVPKAQPADLYTGVLIDRMTGLPQGTLSLRIAD